jgi:ribosomal protein S25
MNKRLTSRQNRKYHGLGATPTYRTWYSMIERCTNPSNASFKNYGARGITVCKEWAESIENFVSDMGLRPPGKTIDRIDSNIGYTKDNCKWSCDLEQQRNKRNVVINEKLAEEIRAECARGNTQTSVARRLNVHPSLVSRIIKREIWK